VRHKIQTPAYASFASESKEPRLDLHEIVDISEDGIAIQCHTQLSLEKPLNLCLDLADCPRQILTGAQVVWVNEAGRAGLRFSNLPADSLSTLREWLFVNVMTGVANGELDVRAIAANAAPPHPNYTDTLAGLTAVQRQTEAMGSDLAGVLQLLADPHRWAHLRKAGREFVENERNWRSSVAGYKPVYHRVQRGAARLDAAPSVGRC